MKGIILPVISVILVLFLFACGTVNVIPPATYETEETIATEDTYIPESAPDPKPVEAQGVKFLTNATFLSSRTASGVSAEFKKGYADLGRLIGILRENGYDDFVSVEDFTNDKDTVSKLEEDIAYLRTL